MLEVPGSNPAREAAPGEGGFLKLWAVVVAVPLVFITIFLVVYWRESHSDRNAPQIGSGSGGPHFDPVRSDEPSPDEAPDAWPGLQVKLASQPSPLDNLDATLIPDDQRWTGQPEHLVAVVGTGNGWSASSIPENELAVPALGASTMGLGVSPGGIAPFSAAAAVITGKAKMFRSMAFAQHGRIFAVSSPDRVVQVWDLGGKAPRKKFEIQGLKRTPWTLALAADGQKLALGFEDNTVQLWDLSGKMASVTAVLPGPEDQEKFDKDDTADSLAPKVMFAPDGKTLATCRYALRLWDVSGAKPRQRGALPPTITHLNYRSGPLLGFTPDGRTLIVDKSDEHLLLVDFEGTKLGQWTVPKRDAVAMVSDNPLSRAFWISSDGRTVAESETTVAKSETQGMLSFWHLGTKPAAAYFHCSCGQALERTGGVVHCHKCGLWLQVPGSNGDYPPQAARPTVDSNFKGSGTSLFPDKERLVLCHDHSANLKGSVSCFAPDCRAAATVLSKDCIAVWLTASEKKTHQFRLPLAPCLRPLAFAPDGRHLAAVNCNGTISILRLWDNGASDRLLLRYDQVLRKDPNNREALLGRARLYLQRGKQSAADLHSGGQLHKFVAQGPAGVYPTFDASTVGLGASPQGIGPIAIIAALNHGWAPEACSAGFLPDGRRALSADRDGTLRLWDIETGREIRRFHGQRSGGIQSLAVSPDGRHALTGGADHTLRLWSLQSGKELHRFKGHTDAVLGVAFAADGRRALSASWDGTARVWDIASGRQRAVFRGHSGRVWCVALAPNGKLAVSGGEDGTVRLWDPDTGKEIRSLGPHARPVHKLAFAADGRRMLTASEDMTFRLWDIGTGWEVRSFTGHTESVLAVAVSGDGRLALSSSLDDTLVLWETATGEALRVFTTRNPRIIASWRHMKASFGRQGEAPRDFDSLDGQAGSVAFSPDGRLALSGDRYRGRPCQLPLTAEQASWDRNGVRLWQLPLTAEQAIADLTAAIRLDPECAEAYFTRAQILARQMDYDRAIADFTRTIKLDPCHALAYYHRGLVYSDQEKYGPAKADLEIALAINPQLAEKP
jgi:WD40 repeat protein